jgi:hypothetical protein
VQFGPLIRETIVNLILNAWPLQHANQTYYILHYDMSACIVLRVRFRRFGKTIDFFFLLNVDVVHDWSSRNHWDVMVYCKINVYNETIDRFLFCFYSYWYYLYTIIILCLYWKCGIPKWSYRYCVWRCWLLGSRPTKVMVGWPGSGTGG